ncbi:MULTISPECIES: DUF3850 domain-containing protein [unclassified Gilliamella]|uniref:DUF3850 domain-containing protein n=1 Tax=unclassified Gilliamella TaxID=2685620 RepID=UPI00080D906E|nr:DUF3850 domain-containing protein [Gilliamella apicola]OCG35691.1 hypothetical protein A9G32_06375 [Gilliamella apicola]OCG49967.1 hypothetical protein A9G27_02510 [Gilliamella apicola]OCG52202.1 hypothetical protein A9G26_03450 [Gilliamella apicola]
MTTHELKIKSEYFMDVVKDIKKAEIRYNDRNYKVGDILVLHEIDGHGNRTGNQCTVIVSHILDDTEYLREGYVMLSIDNLLTKTGLSAHKSNSETSAQRTLSRLGYTDNGGEEWTPPLGKPPRFDLIDELRKEIAELKSQKHINEIKAQGIEEAVKNADNQTYIGVTGGEFSPQKQYRAEILVFADNLRGKND